MNGLPTEMIDRWQDRAEAADGAGLIYWHMLVGTDPDVLTLAKDARRRLAQFSGLHLTPFTWLHMTALIAGPADQISGDQIRQMAAAAGRLLADVPAVTVTFGKILYHPEAIMLAARPAEALVPVLEAARQATREVTGNSGRAGNKLPWSPHVTIAYSTARQPAGPIISALGQSLPERRVRISSVSLVNQIGPERSWNWHPQATIRLGAAALHPTLVDPGNLRPGAGRQWSPGGRANRASAELRFRPEDEQQPPAARCDHNCAQRPAKMRAHRQLLRWRGVRD